MFDVVQTAVNYIQELSAGNEMLAAAITMSASGLLAFFINMVKGSVFSLFHLVKSQLITTLTFNNTGYEFREAFEDLNVFIRDKCSTTGSRTLGLGISRSEDSERIILTIGYGRHFFWYSGRLMWVTKETLKSDGSERQKEQTTISYFGRSYFIFEKLIREITREHSQDLLRILTFTQEGWGGASLQHKAGLDQLALAESTKKLFRDSFDFFLANKQTYRRLGLPYKHTYILHGQPGTGKTSLVRALASEYNLTLCTINLSGCHDGMLERAIRQVPKQSLILIEDFDSSPATKSREVILREDDDGGLQFLSLTGILNVLDGVHCLDGQIIFLTTNHLDQVDPAIYRAGRVDMIVELPIIGADQVQEHFERLYPELKGKALCWAPRLACDINNLVFRAKTDSSVVEEEFAW